MRILGVSRCSVYSPGRECADSALFQGVVDRLISMGHHVESVSEDNFPEILGAYDGIFNMVRKPETIRILSTVDVPVVNSPQSVLNCSRVTQDNLFHQAGIPVPVSCVCNTTDGPGDWSDWPCWLKRGDSHSVLQSDVVLVHDHTECVALMAQMSARGIGKCLLQKHVRGTLVKVYGVTGYWVLECHVVTGEKDKFGNVVAGDSGAIEMLRADALQELVRQAASTMGTHVFGADVIVGLDGDLKLIDFNDWPSFSSCRERAVVAIADLLVEKFG